MLKASCRPMGRVQCHFWNGNTWPWSAVVRYGWYYFIQMQWCRLFSFRLWQTFCSSSKPSYKHNIVYGSTNIVKFRRFKIFNFTHTHHISFRKEFDSAAQLNLAAAFQAVLGASSWIAWSTGCLASSFWFITLSEYLAIWWRLALDEGGCYRSNWLMQSTKLIKLN